MADIDETPKVDPVPEVEVAAESVNDPETLSNDKVKATISQIRKNAESKNRKLQKELEEERVTRILLEREIKELTKPKHEEIKEPSMPDPTKLEPQKQDPTPIVPPVEPQKNEQKPEKVFTEAELKAHLDELKAIQAKELADMQEAVIKRAAELVSASEKKAEVRVFREQAIRENKVADELLPFISGETKEEISASITKAVEIQTKLVERAKAEALALSKKEASAAVPRSGITGQSVQTIAPDLVKAAQTAKSKEDYYKSLDAYLAARLDSEKQG